MADEIANRRIFDPWSWNVRVSWPGESEARYAMGDDEALLGDLKAYGEPSWALFTIEDDVRSVAYVDVRLEGNGVTVQPHGTDLFTARRAAAVVEEWLVSKGSTLNTATMDFASVNPAEEVDLAFNDPARIESQEELSNMVSQIVSKPTQQTHPIAAWANANQGVLALAGIVVAILITIIFGG